MVEGGAAKSLQQHVTAVWPSQWCKPIILPSALSFTINFPPFLVSSPWRDYVWGLYHYNRLKSLFVFFFFFFKSAHVTRLYSWHQHLQVGLADDSRLHQLHQILWPSQEFRLRCFNLSCAHVLCFFNTIGQGIWCNPFFGSLGKISRIVKLWC